MVPNHFELILEGPKDSTLATREKIKEVLQTAAGFKIVDVDETLESGAISLARSSTPEDLHPIRDALVKAGGRVLIVRSAPSAPEEKNIRRAPAADESTFTGFFHHYTTKLSSILAAMDLRPVESLIHALLKARRENRQIFVLGNGGSASTASHFATDLAKHRFNDESFNFRVISLTDNTSWITATGNDCGYDQIFAAQLKTLMQRGDLVIGISSSGNSASVTKAIEFANQRGGITYAMVGFTGGTLMPAAQHSIYIPTKVGQYGFHEDISLILNHMITIFLYERDKEFISAPHSSK